HSARSLQGSLDWIGAALIISAQCDGQVRIFFFVQVAYGRPYKVTSGVRKMSPNESHSEADVPRIVTGELGEGCLRFLVTGLVQRLARPLQQLLYFALVGSPVRSLAELVEVILQLPHMLMKRRHVRFPSPEHLHRVVLEVMIPRAHSPSWAREPSTIIPSNRAASRPVGRHGCGGPPVDADGGHACGQVPHLPTCLLGPRSMRLRNCAIPRREPILLLLPYGNRI